MAKSLRLSNARSSLKSPNGEALAQPEAAGEGDEIGAAELTRRVADNLRALRKQRELSLDDLAMRSGVSRATLSQIETN